jgi:hypothetical protein
MPPVRRRRFLGVYADAALFRLFISAPQRLHDSKIDEILSRFTGQSIVLQSRSAQVFEYADSLQRVFEAAAASRRTIT